MNQQSLFGAPGAPEAPPIKPPRAARTTPRGRAALAHALERFPLRPTAMDVAALYVHACVAFCPDGWLGEALSAHVENEAAVTFGVDAWELFWRVHPGYQG